jgi:hypothetical protein
MSDSDSDIEHTESATSVPRADSKLFNSIDTYGSNSYYYAHSKSKEFVVPENAKVVEGPGIITGGNPVKIADGEPLQPSVVRRRIDKYSWCDDDSKVRIYIDDPQILPHIKDGESNVSCKFDHRSLLVEVPVSDSQFFVFEVSELNEEIEPSSSLFKVSLGKRVTITMAKKNPETKWYALKRK